MGVWANIYIGVYIFKPFFFFLRGKLVKLEHGKSSLLTGLISLMVY